MTPDPDPAGPGPQPDPAGDGTVAGRLRRLEHDVALLDAVVHDALHPGPVDHHADPHAEPDGAGGVREGFTPRYPSLEAWVTGYFAPMFSRPLSPAVRWCARWWDHAEAISRLEALWRSWEAGRLDPLRGMATWYRDYADPQLAVLLAAGGPFAQCAPDRHAPGTELPVIPAPAGHWDDPDQPDGPEPGGDFDDEPDGQPLGAGSPYRPAR